MCGYSGILFIKNQKLKKIGIVPDQQGSRPSLTISVIGALVGPVLVGSPNLGLLPVEQYQDISHNPGGSSSKTGAQPPKSRGPWQTQHEYAYIDNIFIIAFPAMFLLFNFIYWGICLNH
ncbi:uncharacterized protein LOC111696934 [Eurytemora carolleeae]|uniref:uncharacterized protein LOC111696934 n=1 Tax=Eurytemora carolleeae TaxID=1294199 RepID=UPI000C792A69|nr:uncharacterized protein LOC111696934 [Eurytemora carolleeae]|eukprot:XP_023322514.1 uncharacterized protein LOC111696934 [Eurytemora affinis]